MNHSPRQSASAFTLLELLVVISIIALLAGILIPVVGSVRDNADSTKCAANLRQVGIAMINYSSDNDGKLPGPLVEGQRGRWKESGGKGQLVKIMEKYLDTPADKQNTPKDKQSVMTCPAWARVMKDEEAPVYVMNFEDLLVDYDNAVPWGNLNESREPIKRTVLNTWRETLGEKRQNDSENVNLTKLWAMKDADQEDFQNSQRQPDSLDKMAKKPVHGDHRNTLFYDFHVGKMKLDDAIMP
jgi:prepilin-type N-terminal cleavage/methylation domain-containing protein